MACKTVTLPPFKATLKERNLSPISSTPLSSTAADIISPTVADRLNLSTSEKKYVATINQCTGDTTVFELKSDGQKVPKITSNRSDDYVPKVVDKSESKVIQKSLLDDVYKKGKIDNLRIEQIKTLPPEEVVANGLLRFTEDNQGKETEYAIDTEKTPQLQNEGVPANSADNEFEPFPAKLFYPETLEKNEYKQDFIQFKVITYKPRIFTTDGLKRLDRYDNNIQEKLIKSTIRLPIQGGIYDMNMVSWNTDTMNAIEQAAAFASLSLQSLDIKEEFDKVKQSIETLLKDKKSNSAISSYLHSFFARMASPNNTQSNFFSRGFGSILNPNLELLFQNAELRPFSFRFDLTPRSKTEAKQVRQIIRVFKQSMAVRKGVADIFLKTPMIYELEYINGNSGEKHKSIGRIKLCALKSLNVNYTPSNQYMTYDDAENTMTAYSLDMSFQELEPIYFDDYKNINMTEIGF
jgi:hypothetical protein